MRLLRYFALLGPALMLAVPLYGRADTVSSHLASLNWIAGTYRCSNSSVIGGKRQKATTSTFTIKRNGPWIDFMDPKDKASLTRLTYNRRSGRYVYLTSGSDGSYAVGYVNMSPAGFTIQYPSVVTDPPDDTNASASITRIADGYTFVNSGTALSGKNKGKTYTYKSVCTK